MTCPHLELKTRYSLCSASLNFSCLCPYLGLGSKPRIFYYYQYFCLFYLSLMLRQSGSLQISLICVLKNLFVYLFSATLCRLISTLCKSALFHYAVSTTYLILNPHGLPFTSEALEISESLLVRIRLFFEVVQDLVQFPFQAPPHHGATLRIRKVHFFQQTPVDKSIEHSTTDARPQTSNLSGLLTVRPV